MSKDCWDKIEIISKALGAVLIPVGVAASVFIFNRGASERATAAQMSSIAVGVLMADPNEDHQADDALRGWAISVLERPDEVVPLSPSAGKQLRFRQLGTGFISLSAIDVEKLEKFFSKKETLDPE